MKISVIIVTFNRKEDLIISIPHYLKQTYPDKEIIVVDNGSTDGTKETIPSLFPEVKYYWLPENFDIRSINLGVYWSSGEIIWRCDSDSYPLENNAFEKVIEIFQKYPNIHIIATRVIEKRSPEYSWEWYPLAVDCDNVPPEGYPANGFIGVGAAIRREVFETIGGFSGFGYEEFDFSARAIIAGFEIRYFPNIRVLHEGSTRARNMVHRWLTTFEQYTKFTWKYFPFSRAVGRTFWILFFMFLEGIYRRFNPLVLLEGFLLVLTTVLSTRRTQRCVAPEDKLNKITMGKSFVWYQYKMYKSVIIKKIKSRKKKK